MNHKRLVMMMVCTLAGVGFGKVSDHVFGLDVSTNHDYNDPRWPSTKRYDFQFEVCTDTTVESIEFLAPSGRLYPIPAKPRVYDSLAEGERQTRYEVDSQGKAHWDYEMWAKQPETLAEYGDGLYTVLIHYKDGTTETTHVNFAIPLSNRPIPQPTQQPVLLADEIATPTFTGLSTLAWQPCVDEAVQYIELGLENEQIEGDLWILLPPYATSLPPMLLEKGNWEMDLEFTHSYRLPNNGDGIPCWLYKSSSCNYWPMVD